MSILECKALTKRYGGKSALEGVELSIEPGRIVGLLGPNGSGKTTLIKLANGLLTPTSGEILIDGKAPSPETKAIVSYLPDRNALPDWMTVAQTVDYYADFYADFRRDAAQEMLARLGLDASARVKTLSKGTREKLQLILVMSRAAKLYLLDEPIGGVDPATRDYILHHHRQLQRGCLRRHLHPPHRGCRAGARRGDLPAKRPRRAAHHRRRHPRRNRQKRRRAFPGGVQMLTKLIRHEFRATSRIMWPIFAGMLALTLAMRASQNVLQNESPWLLNLLAVLVTIGFVFGIMALCFAPLVLSAVRFRDHLLKDEGYLTLTLPVNMHQLLASKLIVSAVWYAAAFLAVVLLCMIGAFDFSDWRVVPQFASDLFLSFRKLDSSMQGQALLFALEFFLFCVLGVTAVSLIVYAAYAVGFSFNKHKSALTAVFLLFFFQLVQFAAIAVLANLFCDGFTAWSSLTGVQAGNAIFAVALVCELIVCVIFYLVTYFFLTRKLNLE